MNEKESVQTDEQSEIVPEEMPYMRVGISFYKLVDVPTIRGNSIRKRMPWSYSTIKVDHGNDYASHVPKYDGFTTLPSHTNFQRIVAGKFYNLYEPITHIPHKGKFPHIQMLVRHIFDEQFDMGMDYLQLLYLYPERKLPILLLVSSERGTGKTTWLNFIKLIFQGNVTFNTNDEFRAKFNGDWAGMLVIMVDEVLLNKRDDTERLKCLSTAQSIKIEEKGKDKLPVPFFAKYILCYNNENLPVIIDPEENRYWVRKVNHLDIDDTHFLEKLEAEIPAFLHFLQNRELSTKEESRMWFAPELIATEALHKIMRCSRNKVELDMHDLILHIMESEGVDVVYFTPNDLLELLSVQDRSADRNQVRRVLHESWQLEPANNSLSYNTYQPDFSKPSRLGVCSRKGRYYTITRELIDRLR